MLAPESGHCYNNIWQQHCEIGTIFNAHFKNGFRIPE